MACDLAQPGKHAASPGRNESPDDDVLLEALQHVGLTEDSSVGQYSGGLLEGGRRDEGAGLQARLGDAEQHRLPGRRLAPLRLDRGVGVLEVDPVHLLPLEEVGRAWIVHLGLLQHLPDDYLDMLVVDGDALQPVDLLDLVDEVVGQLLDALDGQDVVRCRVTVEQELALLDAVALLHGEMPSLGYELLDRLAAVLVRHDGDAPLVLVVAAKLPRARDLGDDGVILGTPRLEQLGNPRQTAGDVARLGALHRDTGQHVAGTHLMPGLDRHDRVHRQEGACLAHPPQLADLALLVLDGDSRPQIHATRGSTPIDDHRVGDTGRLILPLADRHAFDQILEVDNALHRGEHRAGIGVPLGEAIAALDLGAVVHAQMRAVRQPVHGTLGAVLIGHDQDGVAAHDHEAALAVLHHVALLDLHRAVEVRLQGRLIDNLGARHTAQMEGAHGELRARLADRLRGDDAHGLAHVDRRAA